jgi:hypothetical protein
MLKKQKENLEVGYFRSRNLSICSLFNIDRHDAALLFAHMELIDESYTEKVNIEKFAKKFFPDGKFVFMHLWSYFVVIFKDSRLGLGTTSYIDNINMAKSDIGNHESVADKEHGTYVEVIAFLFMIVSIEKKHFSHFVYWLIYTVNDEAKTRRGLVAMVNKMWKLDKKCVDKEKQKLRTLHLSAVKKAVKHLEASALDMKTFQIYDFRVQNAFSTPVKHLQAEILKKIANKGFWKKGTEQLKLILLDPSLVVPRLGERNSAGKVSYRSTGDRKYAWFELRDYIEAFFRFHEAANAIVIEPATLFQKLKKKLFPPKIKESTIVPVNLETSAAVTDFSLVEKVDSRKKWSVEKYYDEAESNRDEALRMLEEAQEDLDEPLPEFLFEEEGGAGGRSGNQEGSDDDEEEEGEGGESGDEEDRFIENQYSDDSKD